jgi:hypothetical protein
MSGEAMRVQTILGPKRKRHYSYDESVNEPARLIEEETVDIEGANAEDQNEPVEQVPDQEIDQAEAFRIIGRSKLLRLDRSNIPSGVGI